MKNVFKFGLAVLVATTVTGVSGCGGASNSVEMPKNPVPPPIGGPMGVGTEGGDDAESGSAQPEVVAPAAPEP